MRQTAQMKQRLNRPVTLVGMMGSGKSLVGRRLARALDLPFADSDSLVEAAAGISIAEIFEIAGEAKFRDMEEAAIRKALTAGPMILSTGGGAICAEATARLLCARSIVVWLRADPQTLLSRIGSVGSRPLLHGDDPLHTLRELAESRAGDYGKAHITVTTDDLSAPAATNAVLRALDTHLAVT
ncbi:MAG: shikimate kinase [Candidatus Puniceispirillaceae bacterium]